MLYLSMKDKTLFRLIIVIVDNLTSCWRIRRLAA